MLIFARRLVLAGCAAALLAASGAGGEEAPAPGGTTPKTTDPGGGQRRPGGNYTGGQPRQPADGQPRGPRAPGKVLDPHKANVAMIAEAFKAGEAAFKAENYAGAYEYLVDVAACSAIVEAANFVEQARGRLQEMDKLAADKLDEAKLKKLQGDGPGALEILKVLLEKFAFTASAREALDLILALRGDPRVAAAVDLMSAEELDAAGKYAEAAGKYRAIMEKYPESVPALKSKLRLEAMKKDEKIAAALKEGAGKAAEEVCPNWLGMARGFASNNMPEKARPIFQKIIDNYPDSEYAAKAKEALAELDAAKKQ